MGGFNLGIGVGLKYMGAGTPASGGQDPGYISCFASGVWRDAGLWYGTDIWDMGNE